MTSPHSKSLSLFQHGGKYLGWVRKKGYLYYLLELSPGGLAFQSPVMKLLPAFKMGPDPLFTSLDFMNVWAAHTAPSWHQFFYAVRWSLRKRLYGIYFFLKDWVRNSKEGLYSLPEYWILFDHICSLSIIYFKENSGFSKWISCHVTFLFKIFFHDLCYAERSSLIYWII